MKGQDIKEQRNINQEAKATYIRNILFEAILT